MNPRMSPTSQNHVLVGAIMAALQIVNGATALGDVLPLKVAGLVAIIIAAAQAGWQYYTSATSIPTNSVAAIQDTKTGQIVAGPAAAASNGAVVEVTAVTPPDVAKPA